MNNFFKTYWFYILMAFVTILGFITGWYFFIFLMLPLGFFTKKKNENDQE